MKHLLVALFLFLAVGTSTVHAEDKPFANSFAVVWSFATTDRELIKENLAAQQWCNTDALFNNCCQNFRKKVAWNVTILEFSDILYKLINSFYLIIFWSNFYSICIIIIFAVFFWNFIFVDYWVKFAKIFIVILIKQGCHRARIKC